MIKTLTLQNFKVLRDVEVKLRPLTVIVGPNSSGKSTVLRALELLSDSMSGEVGKLFRGVNSPARCVSSEGSGAFLMACSGEVGGKDVTLTIRFDPSNSRGIFLEGSWAGRPFEVIAPSGLQRLARPARLMRLEFSKLAAPSYPKEVSLALPSDGEGLSSVLAGFLVDDASRFQRIAEQLKQIVPQVENLRIQRVRVADVQVQVGYEILFDMTGAPGVPAAAVSDGTLLTLGMLTVLNTPDAPQLVLIDDLERGLHPKAQADLMHQLRQIQENRPDLQIIATSHSPYLLDSLAAEEVLLTSLGKDGYATVRPLTDHPDFSRWKDLMDAGEFWSTVGESWITEGTGEPVSQ
jgi:predicted ATPase